MSVAAPDSLELHSENSGTDLSISKPQPNGEAASPGRAPIPRSPHAKLKAILLLFVVLLVGAGFRGLPWHASVRTDNAAIAGHVHQVSARVAGTVTRVLVGDNQSVPEGATLLKLDPRDFELRLLEASNRVQQGEAQVRQANATLEQSCAQFAQAQAKRAKSEAEAERARADFARAEQLAEHGRFAVISKQEYDAAKAAAEAGEASLRVAEADVRAAQAQQESAKATKDVALASQNNARVAISDAELQLSYTTVAAPSPGTVGRKGVEVGQRVQPGQALLAIVGQDKWVVANFKETQVSRMRPGQRARIWIDAFPGEEFSGVVDSFSPASGAQFALLPPDNATGNFTKIVQRIPVKIRLDEAIRERLGARLAPGLSATVDVFIGG